jgi:hypothetical protein
MRSVATRDALEIVWGGAQVPGILAYGLWIGNAADQSITIPSWEGSVQRLFRLFGEDWDVLEWRVAVSSWPSPQDWIANLAEIVKTPVRAGAALGWMALDGNFADPPDLFNPTLSGDAVYASYASELGMACSAFIDEPYQSLPPEHLRMLRRYLHFEPDPDR